MSSNHPISAVSSVMLHPRDGAPAHRATEAAAAFLRARGVEVTAPAAFVRESSLSSDIGVRPRELGDVRNDIDLVVALGGDGTLLRVAHTVADHGVPVMGINLGHLGFLAAYGAAQLEEGLTAATEGKLVWSPRMRMHVRVVRGDEVWAETGCNDAYVKHGESPRMLDLTTTISGGRMASYRADGLIVCTPMGSTAYNLSAGGPIVDDGTDTFTITPICPHSLTHRPVVTSARHTIGIVFGGPADSGPATFSVDGLWGRTLEVGDEISITRAARPLQLVPPQATVFEVLRAKLGWQVTRPEGM